MCRRLRSTGADLPVLVLTARDSVSNWVSGLDAGADDYLPKPFALEELLARLRALLRRAIRRPSRRISKCCASPTWNGPGTSDVRRGDRRSACGTEFALLELFMPYPKGAHPQPDSGGFLGLRFLPPRAMRSRCTSNPCAARPKQPVNRRVDPYVGGLGYVLRETPP